MGHELRGGGTDCACNIKKIAPHEFIINGCYEESNGIDRLYLAKINDGGGILWQKIYTEKQNNLLSETTVVPLEDGSFTMAGLFFNEFSNIESTVIGFDAEGGILWENIITNNPKEDWYLKDIEPTSDSGYIMSGFKFSAPQKGWVVKIDSLGNTCQPADCDSVGVVSTGNALVLPVSLVHISPNPAKDMVQVQYDVSGIYPIVEFSLFNMNGQLISTHELPAWKQKEQVDISDLAAGVYLYEATYQSRKIGSGKLVVE